MSDTIRVILTNVQSGLKVADLRPEKWEVSRGLNNTGSFSFSIPMLVPRASELSNYCNAELQVNGVPIISGRVGPVRRLINRDKSGYTVSGLGEAAALARFQSKAESHYQDITVMLILADLLQFAGWDIGQTATMLDSSVVTTIDLRGEEHVLPQIQKVCDAVPGLFWRYGGVNSSGNHTLDFGFFDTTSVLGLVQMGAQDGASFASRGQIESITFSEDFSNLIYELTALGGNYTIATDENIQGVITLDDWIAAGVSIDPDFPILLGDSGQLVIRNNNLYPVGGTARKQFDTHVTSNDTPPTQEEIDQAVCALYQRGMRYLEEHQHSAEEFQLDVTRLQPSDLPEVGNRVWVSAKVIGSGTLLDVYNPVIPGFSYQGSLRVQEYTISGDGDEIQVVFKLTENAYITDSSEDAAVQAYDALSESIPTQGVWGNYKAGAHTRQHTSSKTEGPGVSTDCVSGDGLVDGKTVTIPFPAPESWATSLTPILVEITDGYTYEIVQYPVWPSDAFIVCALREDSVNWSATDSVTVKITWLAKE